MALRNDMIRYFFSNVPLEEKIEVLSSCAKNNFTECNNELFIYWITDTINEHNISPQVEFLLWNALNNLVLKLESKVFTFQSSLFSRIFLHKTLNSLQEAILNEDAVLLSSILSFLNTILNVSSPAVNIAFNVNILFQLLKHILPLLSSSLFLDTQRVHSLFSLFVDKLVILCRQHDIKEVMIKVVGLLKNFLHILYGENKLPSILKNKLADFLTMIFCHKDLCATYNATHKSGKWKEASTGPAECFFSTLYEMLNDECQCTRQCTAKFLSLFLVGIVERTKSSSSEKSDYIIMDIFCNMLEIDKPGEVDKEHIELKLSALGELLLVCARPGTSFTQSPISEKELGLLRHLSKVLLSWEKPLPLVWFGCFHALFQCSPEILQQYVISVWKKCSPYNAEVYGVAGKHKQSALLCLILKKFVALHQLPDLIIKVFTAMEKQKVEGKHSSFSREFLLLFSEAVAMLPVGQSLQVWKEFLRQMRLLFGNKRENQVQAVRQTSTLFATFLLHFRLTESCSQMSSLQEVKTLMEEMQLLFKESAFCCDSSECHGLMAEPYLWLSYAWGELHLTLSFLCRTYNATSPNIISQMELFDLSIVQNHLSGPVWEQFSSSSNSQKSTHFVIILLLIQKVRAFYIVKKELANSDCVQSVAPVVKYILDTVTSMKHSLAYCSWNNQILTVNDKTYFAALWSSILKWLPLLSEYATCKQLLGLCTMMIEFLQTQEKDLNISEGASLKVITKQFIDSDAFVESRILQTSFITALWKHSNDLFASIKRKADEGIHEDVPTEFKVLKYLHKHPKIWLEYSSSDPSQMDESASNPMWLQLQKAASLWEETILRSSSNMKVNIQPDVVHCFIEVMSHLSLGNLLPGNQIRCVLGLLCLQSMLRESGHERFTCYTEIARSLVHIFNGSRYVWITNFVKPSVILQHQINIVCDIFEEIPVDEEMFMWIKLFLEKVNACILRKENCQNVESFLEEISVKGNSLKLGGLLVLSSLLKQLTLILKSSQRRLEEIKDRWQTCVNQVCLVLEEKLPLFVEKVVSDCNNSNFVVLECGQVLLDTSSGSFPQITLQKTVDLALRVLQQNDQPEMFRTSSLKFLYSLASKKENLLKFKVNYWKEIWNCAVHFAKAKHKFPLCHNNNRIGHAEGLDDFEMLTLLVLIKNSSEADVESIFCHLLNLGTVNDINNVDCCEMKLLLQLCTNMIRDADLTSCSHVKSLVLELVINGCLLLNQVGKDEHHLLHVVVPFLQFFHFLLGKGMSFLRLQKILNCLQSCASLPLIQLSSIPTTFIVVCNEVCAVVNQILLEHQVTTVQAVAPIFACLSCLLPSILEICECKKYDDFQVNTKQEIIRLIDSLTRIFTLVVKYKDEFSKSAIFLVSTYITATEKLMLHPQLKPRLLLCVYQLLNGCSEHSIRMLQTVLSPGGKELFKVFYSDYNDHYRYKGVV